MTDVQKPTEIEYIRKLSSTQLEQFVAAIFQSQGYYVERNLKWPEPRVSDEDRSVDILEADILARHFSPFGESRILIECKGGCTFTDLFKFIGIKQVVKPAAAFLICSNSSNFQEIERVGKENDIVVIRPEDIIKKFNLKQQHSSLQKWTLINGIEDALLETNNIASILHEKPKTRLSKEQQKAYSEIRKYNSVLKGQYWKESDPRLQSAIISDLLLTKKDFVRHIAREQGIKAGDTENAIAQNVLCESAASLVVKAKLSYLISALRCAIFSLISTDENYIDSIKDESFKSVVMKIMNNIPIACRLPAFIQWWIYQWGGLLNQTNNEIKTMAKQFGERSETIIEFITLLDEIFSIMTQIGSINWGIHKTPTAYQLKGLPDSYKGVGTVIREENGVNMDSTPFSFIWKNHMDNLVKTFN